MKFNQTPKPISYSKQQIIEALDECVKKLDNVIQNRSYTLMKRAQARKKEREADGLC